MYRQMMVSFAILVLLSCSSFAQDAANRPVSSRRSALAASVPIIKSHELPEEVVWISRDGKQEPGEANVLERLSDREEESPIAIDGMPLQELDPTEVDIREQRRQTLKDWPRIAMSEINIDPRDMAARVPEDRADPLIERYSRDWTMFDAMPKQYCWVAPTCDTNRSTLKMWHWSVTANDLSTIIGKPRLLVPISSPL